MNPAAQNRLADAATLMATNFLGAFHCAQAVVPHMKARRAGRIINIASVAGLRGIPNSSIYSASKAALIAFSDAIRIELAPFGIHVSVLCPNRVKDTSFFDNAKRYGSLGLCHIRVTLTADAVAAAVLKTVLRPKPIGVIPFASRAVNTLKGTSGNYSPDEIRCRPTLRAGETLDKFAASQKRPTTPLRQQRVAGGALNKFAPSLVDHFLAKNIPKPGPASPVRP